MSVIVLVAKLQASRIRRCIISAILVLALSVRQRVMFPPLHEA